jgi:hypothetical protein
VKRWLEIFPEKLVFGSDAVPYCQRGERSGDGLVGCGKRRKLTAALAEMVHLELSKIARGYFHDDTARLLGVELLSERQ